MKFSLKQQAIDILMKKYKIKKSLIKKIETKINFWGIVKTSEDYFDVINKIISTHIYINSQIKEFSSNNASLINGISLAYIVEYELRRKYGINTEKYVAKSLIKK